MRQNQFFHEIFLGASSGASVDSRTFRNLQTSETLVNFEIYYFSNFKFSIIIMNDNLLANQMRFENQTNRRFRRLSNERLFEKDATVRIVSGNRENAH